MNRTLCLFSSYFEQSTIPHYIQYYLLELRKHAQEVLFLSNEKQLCGASLEFLAQHQIRFLLLPNQGYDFGQWYRALEQVDLSSFDRLILANDSCILFRSLDHVMEWFENSGLDYGSITDSVKEAYHLQSYFLIIGKRALPHVAAYFKEHGIVEGIGIRMRKVIEIYEIGMTQYLISKQLRAGAMIPYSQSGLKPPQYDMCFNINLQLVEKGSPVIKRRFLTGDFRDYERISFFYTIDYYLPSVLRKKISEFCKKNNLPLPDWERLIGKQSPTAPVAERLTVSRWLSEAHISCISEWIYKKDFLTGWLALWRLLFRKKEPSLLLHGLYWTKKRMLSY